MQWHTAGHLLDEAVKEILPEFHGVKGSHGLNNQHYIEYKGFLDASYKDTLTDTINQIIARAEPITTRLVTLKEIEAEKILIPFKLPQNKPLRLLQIGERPPVPDGGTQLASTIETWPITLTDFEYQDGHTRVHYRCQEIKAKNLSQVEGKSQATLQTFQNQLKQIEIAFTKEPKNEATKTTYLGKKGLINTLSRTLPKLPQKDRAQAGKAINQLKATITTALAISSKEKATAPTWIDITKPGTISPLGRLHPITQAIQEIVDIFSRIGFTRVRYPEIDYDYYVFEALNMPPQHPARDEWETFFIDTPSHHPELGALVLTTHTSNGQVREMKRVGKPPIRMLNIAKCYRRQQDVTHTAMFHQFEGLVIDHGINIQHLKGTLDHFAREFYGPTAKSRIRPFMFKFTEPSFEVDFSCTHCQGKGVHSDGAKCRFCKSGWHEVGGAGMSHPNVLKAGGIDPEKYTGFAFGWGVERVYTLKPGLELDDIRPLYGNNLEFLANF